MRPHEHGRTKSATASSSEKEQALSVDTKRRTHPLIAQAAASGSCVGAIDAIDAIVGGFAQGIGISGLLCLVLALAVLGAACGTVVGAFLLACSGLKRFRVRWPSQRVAAMVLAGVLTMVCSALLVGLRMALPISPAIAVVGAILAGIALTITAWRRPEMTWLVWVLLFVWSYWLGSRLLYSFSRTGVATSAHAVSMVGICAIGAFAFGCLGRYRVSNRGLAGCLLVSALVLVSARPLLGNTSHALRLVLYERTSFGYRLLAALPGEGIDLSELTRQCPPPKDLSPLKPVALDTPMRGVVVIMIDALRFDRFNSETTPNLVAMEGFRFVNAFAPAPATKHAIRAAMTGAESAAGADQPTGTIIKRLKASGVRTHGIANHSTVVHWIRDLDTVELIDAKAKANREVLSSKETSERARVALASMDADEPFFLFAHFFDPHAYYIGNPMFDGGTSLAQRYDAEVKYTDHHIGLLLAELANRDDVAVLVFSDHGEEFWDHRYRWHRTRVYDESVRVPIVLRVPGHGRKNQVEGLTSIADIASTILDLYGLEHQRSGPSLLTSARSRRNLDDRALFLFSDIEPTHAVVQRTDKVIVNLETGVVEHYDLANDPAEQRNLADPGGPRFDALRCLLGAHLSKQAASKAVGNSRSKEPSD